MKIRRTFLILFVLAALFLLACGPDAQAAIATGFAQTQQISALETAAAAGSQPTQQDQAGATETVGTTVEVTTSRDLNMRAGDSTAYSVMTVIPANETVLVTGVNEDSSWYQVEYNGAVGWISATYTEGDVPADMPIATAPTLANNGGGGGGGGNDNGGGNNNGGNVNWSGTWTLYIGTGGSDTSLSITQTGDNINGTFTESGETASFHASLSSNHRTANGSWSTPSGYAGTFQWQIQNNTDQFVGNDEVDFGGRVECGSRSGASRPSACGTGGNDGGGSTDTGWAGDWNLRRNQFTISGVHITVSGSHLQGSFEYNGHNYSFAGTISSDGKSVSGNFTLGVEGQFVWKIQSGNSAQFKGKYGDNTDVYPFCGWRPDSSIPNPCLLP
jgi:uncharacterized protein YgiM (DUF1202 family)